MKIQNVVIDGFKNLSNVEIKFNNITALVALNNFGKSNVLSAIDFGLKFIKSNIENKSDMMANRTLIPIHRDLLGRNYKFEIGGITEINQIEYDIVYGYEFSWQVNEEVSPVIISEYLKSKPRAEGQKYTQLIKRNEKKASYKSSETGRCSSLIIVENKELVVNKLLAYDKIFYIDIIKDLNNMRFYMETHLDVKNCYCPNPIIRKGIEGMTIDVENLPRVMYQLKKNNPDLFELLKDVYRDLFPSVDDIIIRKYEIRPPKPKKLPDEAPFIISDAIYLLFVKDRNLIEPISFELMSDGAKRVFMILSRIILADIGNVSLIAIEEPENSVHPALFQSYVQIISQLLDDCKILITSHSPYIVNYLDPSWLHIGVNNESGVAKFYGLKKSGKNLLQKDAAAFKMSMGDYLFSLLSDEDKAIESYLECDIHE